MGKRFIGFLILLFAMPSFAQADSIVRVGACKTPGVTLGVFIQDSFAYISDLNAFTIVDISLPVPSVISSNSDPWTEALSVFVRDTIAYLHAFGICTIVNISNPDSIQRIGWCYIPIHAFHDPKGICVIDTLCYISRGSEGLVTINVANLDSPVVIDTFDTPGYAMDLFIQDTIIYIADMESLQVINVTNPIFPYRIGSCAMPNWCYDVFS